MTNYIKSIVAPLAISIPLSSYVPDPDKSRIEVSVQQEQLLDELLNGNQQEKTKIMNSWDTKTIEKRVVEAQSSIDSIAYRHLFESTALAKDSDAVAQFNKIAKNTRPERMWGFPSYEKRMDEILLNNGVSQKEIYKFHTENQHGREKLYGEYYRATPRDNRVVIARNQFSSDSVAYQRFFENNKLLDKNVVKEIKAISKKVRPKM